MSHMSTASKRSEQLSCDHSKDSEYTSFVSIKQSEPLSHHSSIKCLEQRSQDSNKQTKQMFVDHSKDSGHTSFVSIKQSEQMSRDSMKCLEKRSQDSNKGSKQIYLDPSRRSQQTSAASIKRSEPTSHPCIKQSEDIPVASNTVIKASFSDRPVDKEAKVDEESEAELDDSDLDELFEEVLSLQQTLEERRQLYRIKKQAEVKNLAMAVHQLVQDMSVEGAKKMSEEEIKKRMEAIQKEILRIRTENDEELTALKSSLSNAYMQNGEFF